jgi:hypothetical protein
MPNFDLLNIRHIFQMRQMTSDRSFAAVEESQMEQDQWATVRINLARRGLIMAASTISRSMPTEAIRHGTACTGGLHRDSSVELDQVLKDQLAPGLSARLHKQSTFRQPAKLDRRETKSFRKRRNLRCCAVVVARQENDSPAAMYGRVLVKDGSDQMVEALDQSPAGEGLRDDFGGSRLSSELFRGTP